MKPAAIAAALLFILPSIAQGYTVRMGAGPLNDQQSHFDPIDIGSSRFAERTNTSSARDNGGASTFGLKNMDSATRLRTENTLATLGAKKEGDRIIVSLPGDVLFDFDRSNIRVDARPVLSRLASVLEAMPQASVMIVGHTDSKGDDDSAPVAGPRRIREGLALRSGCRVAFGDKRQGRSIACRTEHTG